MRNIILFSLDTLRASSMSCYGHSHLTTPHLDALVADATLFESCISPHIPTHPAHTTMFTGKDVLTHQIITQGGRLNLSENIKTLPELLSEAGFFTVAADNLGRWFQRGFPENQYRGYQWETRYRNARKAEAVNQTAIELLELAQSQDKPWFAFLHYWDPHTPYLPPLPFERMFYSGDECDPNNRSMDAVYACEPFTDYFRQWMCKPDPDDPDDLAKKRLWTDRRYVNSQYDASIAYMDASLAQLFQYLQDCGLMEETLLVITADHGEELDEHQLWYDHHGLYQTNCHIPLIMHCPAIIPKGQRLDGLVSLKDIAPTVLDYAGQSALEKREKMEGASLRSLVENGADDGSCEAIYLTECGWMKKRGWQTRKWKLIVETGGTPAVYNTPDIELYDLEEDPDEIYNLAEEADDIVAQLKNDMDAFLKQRLAETGLPDPTVEQEITMRRIGDKTKAVPLP
ncbi:MAG: sulfatase-like hydrolase/transferase [Candidatus Poribacteria bacterium]|nr:sulfatase-like hydrolase/transferase [Candidatus Poribacteria bacterium]